MSEYTLSEPVHDVPRYEGDPIQCGTRYGIYRDGVEVARIYVHPSMYEGGRALVNMSKICWAGPMPENCLSAEAALFHDLVCQGTTKDEALQEAIPRIERMVQWRKDNAKVFSSDQQGRR